MEKQTMQAGAEAQERGDRLTTLADGLIEGLVEAVLERGVCIEDALEALSDQMRETARDAGVELAALQQTVMRRWVETEVWVQLGAEESDDNK